MIHTYLYLIANAFHTYLYFRFFSIFYKEKRVNTLLFWIYGSAFFIINSLVYLQLNTILLTGCSNLLFLYGTCFLYKGNWQKYLFVPISAMSLAALAECIMAIFFMFSQNPIPEYPPAITVVLSDFLFFMLILVIQKITSHDTYLPVRYWFLLFMLPLLSFIITLTLVLKYTISPLQLFVIFIALVMINILIFWLYDRIGAYYMIQHQLQILQKQTEMYSTQLLLQQQSDKQIRKIKHDLVHHIEYIYHQLQQNNIQEACDYITTLHQDISKIENNHISGNPVIDGILNIEKNKALKGNTDFQVEAKIPVELPFDEKDICIILFNLINNAVEAQEYITNTQKSFISIHITARTGIWKIKICNSCQPNYILKKGELPKTKKKDSFLHGIGIQNIITAAEKYHGNVVFSAENGSFTSTVYLTEPISK